MADNQKFCAYGAFYKDRKGILIEERDIGALIKYEDSKWSDWWEKGYYKIFDSKKDRDNWINEQNYQYDER
ncbi:MAG: hypothetical protein WC466_06845 [Candidatus Izemoplasmatales bacterium]